MVSIAMGVPHSWMVDLMENPSINGMRTGGTPMTSHDYGNLQMWVSTPYMTHMGLI